MLHALVRRPSAALSRCELTHVRREPIDVEAALAEHAAYCEALRGAGARVEVLPTLGEAPDAAFVEDAALVLDEVAVIARMGAQARRVEAASVEAALAPHRELLRIEAPGTFDGGDAFCVEGTVYVGQSTRTNHAGLKQLAHRLLPHGYRVKAVEVPGALHLLTACSYLGQDTVLANPRWANLERLGGLRVLPVDPLEPFAANTLRVGETLFVQEGFPRTRALLEERGFAPVPLALEQLSKAEAGLTCLSLLFDSEA